MAHIEIVDPRGAEPHTSLQLARRPRRDHLQRIGLLCNESSVAHGTMHFSRYLSILRRGLIDRLGPLQFMSETKPILTRPAEDAQLDRFLGWQAVINGLGK